jgi:hypothetical protein
MPVSSKWSPSLRSSHQNPVCISPLPAHLILLDLITRMIFYDEYRSLSSLLCSLLHSPVPLFPLRPKYLPQHPILEHPQPMFIPQCERSSFTTIQNNSKIIVLYVLIFVFLDSKLEDRISCTKW